MSLQQSKIFFEKLKETCRNIDSNVSKIKKKLDEVPDGAAYSAAKCVTQVQDRIQKLKTESNELKFKLEPQLVNTTGFIQHFRELTAETEVSVGDLENYLKQYGYIPLNSTVSSPSPEKSDISPLKNVCHQNDENLCNTPNLLNYGIASHQHSSSILKFKDRKSSFEDLIVSPMVELKNIAKDKENSGSTPTIEIDSIPHIEEETPPLSGSLQIVPQFPSTPKLEL